MSQNIKYTTYTVTSYMGNDVPPKKTFSELEIQEMIRYVQEQNKSGIYMEVTKTTITMNYHLSKSGFRRLKQQKAPESHKPHKKIYRIASYCGIDEPKSPNAGFFDFIGYQR